LRAVSTAWPAITSAPRSSHPTGSSECLEAFWCCIRFLGALDELAMCGWDVCVLQKCVCMWWFSELPCLLTPDFSLLVCLCSESATASTLVA
jgi:hypothetical protein